MGILITIFPVRSLEIESEPFAVSAIQNRSILSRFLGRNDLGFPDVGLIYPYHDTDGVEIFIVINISYLKIGFGRIQVIAYFATYRSLGALSHRKGDVSLTVDVTEIVRRCFQDHFISLQLDIPTFGGIRHSEGSTFGVTYFERDRFSALGIDFFYTGSYKKWGGSIIQGMVFLKFEHRICT